jgi:hypothetical protein
MDRLSKFITKSQKALGEYLSLAILNGAFLTCENLLDQNTNPKRPELLFVNINSFFRFLSELGSGYVDVVESHLWVDLNGCSVIYGLERDGFVSQSEYVAESIGPSDKPQFYCGYLENMRDMDMKETNTDYYILNDGNPVVLPDGWNWSLTSIWESSAAFGSLFSQSLKKKKKEYALSCSNNLGRLYWFIHLDSKGKSVPPSSAHIRKTLLFRYSTLFGEFYEGFSIYFHKMKVVTHNWNNREANK